MSDFNFPDIEQRHHHFSEDPIIDSVHTPFKIPPNVVKLHYEKYSPHYSDDMKELEIFLEKYLPILKSDKAVDVDGQTKQVVTRISPLDFPPVYDTPSVADSLSLHQHAEPAGPVTVRPSIVDITPTSPTSPTTDTTHNSLHDTPYVSPFHLAQPVLVNDDKQKEYEEIKVRPNNQLFSGLLPHAINIQINIPPSDDRQYKDSDSYREEKLISVTPAPGYHSALGDDYGLPPKLPGYSPTVTPALPPYQPSTTARPHLLPHHPPPASHHQAGHRERPSYEPPTPASIELPHTPHNLISEFRPPHAEYLGMGS